LAKTRISATVDAKTEKKIERILKEGKYRNKSHIIEEAIDFFDKAENNGKHYEEDEKKYCLICLDGDKK